MTVERLNVSSGPYNGNGVTTAFPITFEAASADEVGATLNGVDIAQSSFFVTLNPDRTGTATFYTAPMGAVVLYSAPLFDQTTNFEDQGPFFQSDVNEPIDRSALRDLVLLDRANRSIEVPRGEVGLRLPPASQRRDRKILGFNRITGAVEVQDGSFFIGPEGPTARIDLAGLRFYTPEQFGAIGNAIANDQPAFDLLNAALALTGTAGAQIELGQGKVYNVGKQTPGKNGYYLWGDAAIYAGYKKALVINMNGATLRMRSGLKWGGFNATTGMPENVGPGTDISRRADAGLLIQAEYVDHVHIYGGGTLDCNSAGLIVGGTYGDTGRQCSQYGILVQNYQSALIEDVLIQNSALDGITQAHYFMTTATPPKPAYYRNVRIRRCGRNCFSLIGGNLTTIDTCHFSEPGQVDVVIDGAPAVIGSAPASCLDIEPELSIVRNTRITGSVLDGRGGGSAFICDSGDSADTLLDGGAKLYGSVWTSKLGTRFIGVTINGIIAKVRGGDLPFANTTFQACTLTDEYARQGIDTDFVNGLGAAGGGNFRFDDCFFDLSKTRLMLQGGEVNRGTVVYRTGTDRLASGATAIALQSATVDGLLIVEAIPAGLRPATPYKVGFDDPSKLRMVDLRSASGKLEYNSVTVTGYPLNGLLGKGIAAPLADLPGDATLADVTAKVNAMLATDRAAELRRSA